MDAPRFMKEYSINYFSSGFLKLASATKMFALVLCFLSFHCAFSNTPDSLLVDTLSVDTVKVHSVKKASIYSAVLPGLGQIYNHRAMPKGKKKALWKVPLIYTALGATTYFALKNNSEQRNLKTEYSNRVDTMNIPHVDQFPNLDNQGLLTLYDQKVRRRDLFFIGLGFVYLLQIADAAVEAHFVSFDVSDDLSMKIYPTLLPTQTLGVGIKFNFR